MMWSIASSPGRRMAPIDSQPDDGRSKQTHTQVSQPYKGSSAGESLFSFIRYWCPEAGHRTEAWKAAILSSMPWGRKEVLHSPMSQGRKCKLDFVPIVKIDFVLEEWRRGCFSSLFNHDTQHCILGAKLTEFCVDSIPDTFHTLFISFKLSCNIYGDREQLLANLRRGGVERLGGCWDKACRGRLRMGDNARIASAS